MKSIIVKATGAAILLAAACQSHSQIDVQNRTSGPCSPIVSNASPNQNGVVIFNCIVGSTKQRVSEDQLAARAEALARNGYPQDAKAIYDDLIKGIIIARPGAISGPAAKKLADLNLRQAKIASELRQDPEEYLRRAYDNDPARTDIRNALASYYWSSNQTAKAINLEREFLKDSGIDNPNVRAAYRRLLRTSLLTKNFKQAQLICDTVSGSNNSLQAGSCFPPESDKDINMTDNLTFLLLSLFNRPQQTQIEDFARLANAADSGFENKEISSAEIPFMAYSNMEAFQCNRGQASSKLNERMQYFAQKAAVNKFFTLVNSPSISKPPPRNPGVIDIDVLTGRKKRSFIDSVGFDPCQYIL